MVAVGHEGGPHGSPGSDKRPTLYGGGSPGTVLVGGPCCMAEYGHDRGLCCSPTQNWREAHAVWLRSTTKKDHAVVRVLERGPRWMATVGHNERLRGSPGIGQRPTLYGGAAAVGHDEGPRGSPGTGERPTLYGGGWP
jgi:hypothetical protein